MSPSVRNSLVAAILLVSTLGLKVATGRLEAPDDARLLSDIAALGRAEGFAMRSVPVGATYRGVEGRRGECVFRALPIRPGGYQLDIAERETRRIGPAQLWYGKERHDRLPRLRPLAAEYTLRIADRLGYKRPYTPLLFVARSAACDGNLPSMDRLKIHLRQAPVPG